MWHSVLVVVGGVLGGVVGACISPLLAISGYGFYIGFAAGFAITYLWNHKEVNYEIFSAKVAFSHALWGFDVKDGDFHKVVEYGHIGDIEHFLGKWDIINAVIEKYGAPLHCAIRYDHKDVIEYLLNHGADIDIVAPGLGSPLHYACSKGNLDIINLLIENNAQINISDEHGYTPLYYALAHNKISVAEILLENFADFKTMKDAEKLLHMVVQKGYYEAAEKLISLNADPNVIDAKGKTPIFYALEKGYIKLFNLLVESKADLNKVDPETGNTLLHIAVQKGYDDVAEKLISLKVNLNVIDVKGKTPIFYALEKGYIKLANLLVESKADLNKVDPETGDTLLHIAAHKGLKDVFETIAVTKDVNLDVRNKAGESAMVIALLRGNVESAKFIKNKGCKFDAKAEGERIIIDAAKNNKKDVFKYLVEELSVNINSMDSKGNLPICYANGELFTYICNHGGNVNWENDLGETLLHTAAKAGDREKVKALLAKGADPWRGNNDSVSILYDALFNGHVEIAEDLYRSVDDMRKRKFMQHSGIYSSNKIINKAATEGLGEILYFYEKHSNHGMPNLEGAIFIALSNNHPITAQKLKDMGAPFKKAAKQNIELFCKAIKNEWTGVVKKMLEFGVKVDNPDNNNHIPIYYTLNNNTVDTLKLLWIYGADLNKVDPMENSTLLCLAIKNKMDFVRFLIPKSSKEGLNIVDIKTNKTPLQLAIDLKQMPIIKLLLEHPNVELKRADFTAISKLPPEFIKEVFETLIKAEKIGINDKCFAGGQTFMHIAAKLGDINLITKLKDYGVSLEIPDDKDLIPVRIAYENSISKECINALIPGMEYKPPVIEPSAPPVDNVNVVVGGPSVPTPSAPPVDGKDWMSPVLAPSAPQAEELHKDPNAYQPGGYGVNPGSETPLI
ncbi:MAG: serine/threonine-protein phosphatase 6 regulatory ankyrin repeat subunit A-like [Candidatus Midichloriaceae bacterium]|jgi:ankyrin repeat protein|nr:serine/threonine-protein phosphatase 6 regulatory ankyrin repeat subunit A-like [Candidatus Midichloriaceae bacterium]